MGILDFFTGGKSKKANTSKSSKSSSGVSAKTGVSNEITFENYGIFNSAVGTTKKMVGDVENASKELKLVKDTLSNESVFMGPVADGVNQALSGVDGGFSIVSENMNSIANYINTTAENYKNGDTNAGNTVLNLKSYSGEVLAAVSGDITTPTGEVQDSVTIPDDVKQSGYTVTCYGEGGWYLGGGETPTSVAPNTNQKAVHDAWLKNGAKYKDGIAVMNVNGKESYLIATSSTLGKVGDNVNVKFKDGKTINCIIADQKSSGDSNYTKYGHSNGKGSINILEFEVDRKKYNDLGNPSTKTWDLEWDSSSNVERVDNYGSIIKK